MLESNILLSCWERNGTLARKYSELVVLRSEERLWISVDKRLQDKEKKREYDQLNYLKNKDKKRDSVRKYYLLNEDKRKDYDRRFYIRHRDRRADYMREYNLQNESKKKNYNRRYYLQNEDKTRDYLRQYVETNKDRVKELNRRLRIRNHDNPSSYSPRGENKSWKTPELVREYFESIAQELMISTDSDWYRISCFQIQSLGGGTLYSKFGSLGVALQYAYPRINWDLDAFSLRGKKAEQRWLRVKIEQILPDIEIIEDFYHPDLSWDNSVRNVEIDLWIPQHRIGFEYQGEQHYYNLESAFGPNGTTDLYWERDTLKISACKELGITLIEIPYWWDGDIESLSATLHCARPDVFPKSNGSPIPSKCPSLSFNILDSKE